MDLHIQKNAAAFTTPLTQKVVTGITTTNQYTTIGVNRIVTLLVGDILIPGFVGTSTGVITVLTGGFMMKQLTDSGSV